MLIPSECDCGALSGTVNAEHMKGYRAICLCDDCQAYAHFLRRSDVLDANGGTDIFPVTPARIKITRGVENLCALRLSAKGAYRWYAGCCNSPIGNTSPSPALPFVGLVHTILEKKTSREVLNDCFGPVQARIRGKFGLGELPPGASRTVPPGFLARVLKFAVLGWLRGERQPSAFFDKKGLPERRAYVLTEQEREALRPLCGPKTTS